MVEALRRVVSHEANNLFRAAYYEVSRSGSINQPGSKEDDHQWHGVRPIVSVEKL